MSKYNGRMVQTSWPFPTKFKFLDFSLEVRSTASLILSFMTQPNNDNSTLPFGRKDKTRIASLLDHYLKDPYWVPTIYHTHKTQRLGY